MQSTGVHERSSRPFNLLESLSFNRKPPRCPSRTWAKTQGESHCPHVLSRKLRVKNGGFATFISHAFFFFLINHRNFLYRPHRCGPLRLTTFHAGFHRTNTSGLQGRLCPLLSGICVGWVSRYPPAQIQLQFIHMQQGCAAPEPDCRQMNNWAPLKTQIL
jgi:hypothetical protein